MLYIFLFLFGFSQEETVRNSSANMTRIRNAKCDMVRESGFPVGESQNDWVRVFRRRQVNRLVISMGFATGLKHQLEK